MKNITDHILNGLNEAISVIATDEPGPGGAHHEYDLVLDKNPEATKQGHTSAFHITRIKFQKGPILESGFNGLSNEALLAVLIDRMRGFQSGQYACRDNAIALTYMEESLMWLQKRTRDRLARGVEGTNAK